MLRTLQGILIVATVCAATLTVAHPVRYATAVAGTEQTSKAPPDKVYSAVAGDTAEARAQALAQCRKATNRDCVVIDEGPHAHAHE